MKSIKEVVGNVTDAAKHALGLDAPLQEFRAALADLEARDAALGQERDGLLTQPPVPADAADVPRLVAARRAAVVAAYPELHHVAAALAGGLVWMGEHVHRSPAHLPDVLGQLSAFDLAVILDPEALAAKLLALVPTGGPSALTIERRLARIAVIDREREAIAREHAALVDRAGSLGVVVEHLAVTRERLLADASERARTDRQRDEIAYDARRRGRA